MPGYAGMHVPDYLVWSILCLFLCLPGGIGGIVYSNKAKQLGAAGDYPGALQAARTAKTWCWVSLAVGVISVIVVIAANAGGSGS